MSDGFVVVAEFDIPRDRVEAFVRLVRENAAASVRDEPHCRRFDVLIPELSAADGASRVVLYEVYRDPEAFDAHLRTSHFKAFQEAATPLIAGREVRRFDLHENAKHD